MKWKRAKETKINKNHMKEKEKTMTEKEVKNEKNVRIKGSEE